MFLRYIRVERVIQTECGMEARQSVIGFPPSSFTKVRWAGQRGSNDSTVAPFNVAYALLMSLNTRGSSDVKAGSATAMCRAMGKLAGKSDEEIAVLEAPTSNPGLANMLSNAIGAPTVSAVEGTAALPGTAATANPLNRCLPHYTQHFKTRNTHPTHCTLHTA
jgi:hypothetical protein